MLMKRKKKEKKANEIKIRPATLEDAGEISQIIQGNFRGHYYKHYSSDELTLYLCANTPQKIEYEINNKTARMFVADYHGEIGGVVLLNFDETRGREGGWRIRRMHTHPDFAGLSLSDRLLDQAYFHAMQDGHNTLYAEPTPEVEPFFRSKGWTGYLVNKLSTTHQEDGTLFTTHIKKMIAEKDLKEMWYFG